MNSPWRGYGWRARLALRKLRARLRLGIRQAAIRFLPMTGLAAKFRAQTFQEVYADGLWGSLEGQSYFSGIGSVGEFAEIYTHTLAAIIRDLATKFGEKTTIVDLGCGDFRVAQHLLKLLPPVHYIGCDVVPGLVAENNKLFGDPRISFRHVDIVSGSIPEGHIYLLREVLQHLPNRDVATVLSKLMGRKEVFVTEAQPLFPEGSVNPDKPSGCEVRFDWRTGRGRGLELNRPPFSIPIKEICRVEPRESKQAIITYRLWP